MCPTAGTSQHSVPAFSTNRRKTRMSNDTTSVPATQANSQSVPADEAPVSAVADTLLGKQAASPEPDAKQPAAPEGASKEGEGVAPEPLAPEPMTYEAFRLPD